jgi:hypothetical protein
LIAAPYIAPRRPRHAVEPRRSVWLPEGDWYDFFSGEYYAGDAWYALYGTLDDMPLFARAGAIIPLNANPGWGEIGNPPVLDLHVFAGADGTFTLYEDDGESTAFQQGAYCTTTFTQQWQSKQLTLRIDRAVGDTSLIPTDRRYRLHVHGVQNTANIRTAISDQPQTVTAHYDETTETLIIEAIAVPSDATLKLTLSVDSGTLLSHRDRRIEKCDAMLKQFRLTNTVQQALSPRLDALHDNPAILNDYLPHISDEQARALLEVLFEAGFHRIQDTHYEDMFILWNNHANPAIRYQYALSHTHHFYSEADAMPRFKTIVLQELLKGHRNTLYRRWQFRANYMDLAHFRCSE